MPKDAYDKTDKRIDANIAKNAARLRVQVEREYAATQDSLSREELRQIRKRIRSGSLDSTLESDSRYFKKLNGHVGYVLLHMVYSEAKRGRYATALALLRRQDGAAMEIAGTEYAGLFHIALLDAALQEKIATSNHTDLGALVAKPASEGYLEYCRYLRDNHLIRGNQLNEELLNTVIGKR
ncbi:hypothetical protein HYS31_02990 [Candidatus Woesearchaeota archaeon]|nr:hypothetical protein [Candidatus Woesearchaeota archaeon]